MALQTGTSFTGLRVKDQETIDNLNECADWIVALRNMQVMGCKFEISKSGILIAIDPIAPGGGSGTSVFQVAITGSATLRSLSIAWGGETAVSSPVAWTYSGKQVAYNTSTGLSVDTASGLTFSAAGTIGSGTPPLFNIQELNATTTAVGGTSVAAVPFPTGFRALALDAIATTQDHAQDYVVDVWKDKNSAGADIYVCSVPVRFGGACS